MIRAVVLALALFASHTVAEDKVGMEVILPEGPIKNFIGGEFVAPVSGKYGDNMNPATGKPLCQVAESTAADVDKAVAAATEAQVAWGALSVFERRRAIKDLAQALEESATALATAESVDMGKILGSAAGDDMLRQIRNLRYHAEANSHSNGISSVYETEPNVEKRPGEDPHRTFLNYATRYPVGVVAVIAHWSRPLHQAIWRMAPAIAAGNTVIIKPPSYTPLSTYVMLKYVVEKVNIPPGVINVVYGAGSVVGEALAAHKGIGALAMVGGPQAAAAIQGSAALAGSFKKLKFDLGNNHAMIVNSDADLDKALDVALTAAFGCDAGQRAHSLGRLILHKDIATNFTAKFIAGASDVTIGEPLVTGVDMGPLVSAQQVDRMVSGVKDLLAAGGELLLGDGQKMAAPAAGLEGGNWMAPTIIGGFTGADANKDAVISEHQGPVVKIIVVEDLKEAVNAANAGPNGLSASLWSKDSDMAHSAAQAIDAGYVWVNNWLTRDLSMPFGGWKDSGNGQRSGGTWDVDFYSYTKTVCMEVTGRHKLMA